MKYERIENSIKGPTFTAGTVDRLSVDLFTSLDESDTRRELISTENKGVFCHCDGTARAVQECLLETRQLEMGFTDTAIRDVEDASSVNHLRRQCAVFGNQELVQIARTKR